MNDIYLQSRIIRNHKNLSKKENIHKIYSLKIKFIFKKMDLTYGDYEPSIKIYS